jgi:2-polyprenyl-3-methyl-5-hydroxy-6-metoxy-1,4-benzoquinol methylase
MKEILKCPICGYEEFSEFLKLKDYFLTGEEFRILKCENCEFLFTNPQPEIENLQLYYQSDNYISHSGSKKGILNRYYHTGRNYAVKLKHNLVTKYASGSKVIDIGCGTGELLMQFKRNNWETYGIEPNGKARVIAREKNNIQVGEEEDLETLKSGTFDVVMMWHVLEHVADLNKKIRQVKKIMKKEGTFFVALPNCKSRDASIYGKYWAAYDVPRHLYHFTQNTTRTLFNNFQMDIEKIIPMKLDAYYISLLSEKYRNGKINWTRALINGFRSNRYARKNNTEYSSLIYVVKNI